MRNPLGWILGYLWMLAIKVQQRCKPQGGYMWMPRWVQPYWMRCMGWEVSEGVIQFYKQNR